MMYTMSGADAMEYFQKDPDAFQCYHNGFAEQVRLTFSVSKS